MVKITDNNSIDNLKTAYKANGGMWNDKANLFGIRNSYDGLKDVWNDVIGFADNAMIVLGEGTADPGVNATKTKATGANHVVEGYYPDLWDIEYRKHYSMDVFAQVGKITVWDDVNKTTVYKSNDTIEQDAGPAMGIFMHTTLKLDRTYIGDSSWGCQVWRDHKDFEFVRDLCKKSGLTKFSYLLFSLKREVVDFYKAIYPQWKA